MEDHAIHVIEIQFPSLSWQILRRESVAKLALTFDSTDCYRSCSRKTGLDVQAFLRNRQKHLKNVLLSLSKQAATNPAPNIAPKIMAIGESTQIICLH